MINNVARIGNPTSSDIVALTMMGSRDMTETELAAHKKSNPGSKKKTIESGFGEKGLTYIEECNMERRLGRSLEKEETARSLSWGKLCEKKVFELLGIAYSFNGSETLLHPEIDYWAGSPDGFKYDEGKTVVDYKCPSSLKSFCQLVNPLYDELTGMEAINAIRKGYKDKHGFNHSKHKDGEKFYWQLVSNSIISASKYAELIIYTPYLSELNSMRLLAQNVDAADISKYYWVGMGDDDELPHIPNNGFYKNLNIIRFEVPQEDKDFLTQRVLEAGKMLIKMPSLLLASHDKDNDVIIVEKG